MTSNSVYSVAELFDLIRSPPPYPENFSGRGIVISAGGSYLPSSYLTIRSIRASGCSLPIQVWHLGPKEFPAVLQPLFTRWNVEVIDSAEVQKSHPFRNLSGWQNKPFSLRHCRFEEVLYIDADNVVLHDPSFLFDLPEYLSAGAVFWPDFLTETPQYWSIKDGAWELLGLTPRCAAETESGQLLINKRSSWLPLCATLHMNDRSDFYYERCSYGDKDTFTLAWDACKASSYRIAHRPQIAGELVRYQFTPDGKPLFLHGRKWVLPSAINPHHDWYPLDEACHAWLREFEADFSKIKKAAS